MKYFKQIMLGATMFALLAAAGCAGAKQNQANGQQGGQGQMSGTMGIITEVGASSVTIAVMPAGSGQQGGQRGQGGQANAQAQPNGSGNPAPDASGAPAMTAPDTSSWEKQTFAIAGDTKITEGGGPGTDSSSAKTLTASDLKVGDSVRITAKSGDAKTASEISVMGGGLRGGQGGPGGSAPAATASTKA